jgi:hypothetical protein
MCVSSNGSDKIQSIEIFGFDGCVNAGYQILEIYPRQCKTPDGRTFISQMDVFEITKDVSCSRDEDCQLVNKNHGFSCCWEGACEPIDYSLDKWIAVNNNWFSEQRAENCPTIDKCGPAPMCASKPINENFEAQCVNNVCQKISTHF